MVPRYCHLVGAFWEYSRVGEDVVIFAELWEVDKALETIQVHITSHVERVNCIAVPGMVFVKSDAEIALSDGPQWIKASQEPALCGILRRVSLPRIGGNVLNPQREAAVLGVVGTRSCVERVMGEEV